MERIQDKYEDLSEFENGLNGFTPAVDENGEYKRNEEGRLVGFYGEPKIETLRDALEWMVQEGIEIERENGKEIQEVSGKTLTRKVDMAPKELAEILHAEFARCFRRKTRKPRRGRRRGKNKLCVGYIYRNADRIHRKRDRPHVFWKVGRSLQRI